MATNSVHREQMNELPEGEIRELRRERDEALRRAEEAERRLSSQPPVPPPGVGAGTDPYALGLHIQQCVERAVAPLRDELRRTSDDMSELCQDLADVLGPEVEDVESGADREHVKQVRVRHESEQGEGRQPGDRRSGVDRRQTRSVWHGRLIPERRHGGERRGIGMPAGR